ncbi:hypothetical protein BGZ97_007976 [Linnemannia gamsii]|uniref:BTB domain-containing protein n=1 Tax=Linnemannia gamsii TaxID=64522 RepID=A0A9P6UEX3_9FUNG|nr:hypothetical protein BGZ97_007976 [Linnemannia gamsii]
MPVPIHYKTIALHTPKTLAPLMAMFLDGSSTGDIPIRVELEANAIRHRGNYVFEIVLSEDMSSYMSPSPSSCHRVFDSLYHEIIATSIPDTSTADIWFEFCPHSSTASGAAAADASTQDRSSLPSILLPVDQRHLWHAQEHNDGGAAVAVVGAHSETLRKYRYFAEWIEREKQEQEEQRRRQLEKEWRVHQEHHEHRRQQQQPQQQQQQQQSHPHFPWWHLEPPYHPSEPQIGEFEEQQRLTWVGQPPPATTSSSRSSRRNDQQQQSHPQYRLLQRAEYHPREIPTYFQPLQGPHSSSSPTSSPSSTSSSPSVTPQQQQSNLLPKHQNQQLYSRPETAQSRHQVAEQQQVPPPPALRIPVKNVSLGTFQVILQYIYTGSIGLSDGQIKDVEEYWNGNPENHLAPLQKRNPLDDEDMPSLSSLLAYYHARDRPADSPESGEGSGRIAPRFPIVLPIPEALKEVLRDQQEGGGGEGGQEIQGRPNTSIRDIVMSAEIYTFTTASAQTAWIPCSPRNRRKEFRDPVSPRSSHTRQQPPVSGSGQEEHATGCSSGQSQGDEGGQTSSGSIGFQSVTGPSASSSSTSTSTANTSVHSPTHQLHVHRTRPTCSWESLLVAANLFHLQDLEMTALKAIKYHCQMLASRALINNNVMAEVAHDGFDTSNLDLQLVMGERILLSLLRLYKSRALRVHPEGVRVLRGSDRESGGGGESKCQQEHAHVEPTGGRQSQLEERFRREEQVQQGSSSDGGEGEERKESSYKSDDKKQQKREEGHLETIPTASGSSSSSSARTRGGGNSSGGRASPRTRGSRRLSSGHGQGRGQAAIGEGSSGGNTAQKQQQQHLAALEHGRESYSSARTRTRTTSRHQQQQRQAGTQEHGDNGGNESQRQPSGDRRSASREQREDEQDAEEDEERSGSGAGHEGITTPLALLDHPQCEAALQGLCEELRERFLSLREVMESSPHIDARPD